MDEELKWKWVAIVAESLAEHARYLSMGDAGDGNWRELRAIDRLTEITKVFGLELIAIGQSSSDEV